MYFETLNDFKNAEFKISNDNNTEFMILVAQNSSKFINELFKMLNEKNIKFFGGIYPSLIANNKSHSNGFIVKKVNPVYSELVYPFLMKNPKNLNFNSKYTGLLIGDGFSSKNKTILSTIESKLPYNINYLGGGSAYYDNSFGNYNLKQDLVVFNNNGFFKDAMHLCIIEEKSETEVKFGWEIVDGPYKINRAENNLIHEIHHDNAFDFYKYILEDFENIYITKEDFVMHSSKYTFGVFENGRIKEIRVPISVDEKGCLQVINQIDEGTDIYILKANKKLMLDAVKEIDLKIENKKESLVSFSCITRELYLDDEFKYEIDFINNNLIGNVEGAVSIGEFSNNNLKKELKIYEGACVVSKFY